MNAQQCQQWAKEDFRSARLGDRRLNSRCIKVATSAYLSREGTVAGAMRNKAERDAAYRWLENERFSVEEVVDAVAASCARRAAKHSLVFVAIDGTSLTFSDPDRLRELGPVGTRQKGARGLKVMNTLALDEEGGTIGIPAQIYWRRDERPHEVHHKKRDFEEKESRYWRDAAIAVRKNFARRAPRTRIWYQLDREGDFVEMLHFAASLKKHLVTIRANVDRRVESDWAHNVSEEIDVVESFGQYVLNVPATAKHQAREAVLDVKASRVTLRLMSQKTGKVRLVQMSVVRAQEIDPPSEDDQIEWTLLTNYDVKAAQDAALVLKGYAMRWSIEEMHKTWKTMCHVEDSQLRSYEGLTKWGAIMAAKAARIERIKRVSRTTPQVPATTEFTREEIDAAIALVLPSGFTPGDTPTMREMTIWVASLGGWAGNFEKTPPGSIVLGRGLHQLNPVVAAIENLRALKKM